MGAGGDEACRDLVTSSMAAVVGRRKRTRWAREQWRRQKEITTCSGQVENITWGTLGSFDLDPTTDNGVGA
jgi:hypothetical protein